jgi:hypothetical protein
MLVPLKYVLGAAAGVVLIAALFVAAPWAASLSDDKTTASNALLTCEPSQQVMVKHVAVRGELQLSMQCVGATALVAEPLRTSYASPVPVSYAARPAVVRTASAPRAAAQELEPKRSWKKTALVIGGSAGAGAGVGAIAGGKKGALIGAAIGGGAASIYEAVKRR